MITATTTAVARDSSTDDPTVRFRRVTGAVALPLALMLQLACNTVYAIVSTESGLSDLGAPEETLEFYGRYPGQFTVAIIFAMLGGLVMIPGLLTALRILRPYKPRLALWAVVMMIAGYVCYFGIAMSGFDTLALAFASLPPEVVPATMEQSSAAIPFFIMFVIGNLLGTALLALAVLLSRGLPRWAGVLIFGWPVGHVINVFLGGGEWFAVAGGALEICGLLVLAGVALRTDDRQWRQRG